MNLIINKCDQTLRQYWGSYHSKIRAVGKRGLVLSRKILQGATPQPILKTIKAINLTYIIDIPLGIKDTFDEGKSIFRAKDKSSKFIGINDFFSTGLDLIDSMGTFFGTVLEEDKYFLLKFYETYSMSIGCAIEMFSIASRLGKMHQICQLKRDLTNGDIKTKRLSVIKNSDTPEHRLFMKTFGTQGLDRMQKNLNELDPQKADEFRMMANRKLLALSMGLSVNVLMMGLYIFSPILGSSLAFSSKVMALGIKFFEEPNINKHFIA